MQYFVNTKIGEKLREERVKDRNAEHRLGKIVSFETGRAGARRSVRGFSQFGAGGEEGDGGPAIDSYLPDSCGREQADVSGAQTCPGFDEDGATFHVFAVEADVFPGFGGVED